MLPSLGRESRSLLLALGLTRGWGLASGTVSQGSLRRPRPKDRIPSIVQSLRFFKDYLSNFESSIIGKAAE